MDEDVVCVEEWVGGGVGDVDWGGERMVSKGVESGVDTCQQLVYTPDEQGMKE